MPLEAPEPTRGPWPVDAVDRPGVQAVSAKRYLETYDLEPGAGRRRGRPGERKTHHSDAQPAQHGSGRFDAEHTTPRLDGAGLSPDAGDCIASAR